MKLYNKILFLLFLSVGVFLSANQPPPPPNAVPPGGGGGVGPGVPASPIDMYVYVLAAVAFLLIAYYQRKLHKNLA